MPDESHFDNPRTVSRGLKLQTMFMGVDSLYLVVEYPHIDVFHHWSKYLNQKYDSRLYNGIPVENMLIRRGALGYKFSIWSGDSRLFITDRVDDILIDSDASGQGMGLMLQLGSKWLRQFADFTSYETLSASIYALLRDFQVKSPEKYPIRINRIDIALDVGNLAVDTFSVDEWRAGWVGRASGKHFYDDNKTGKLSGLVVGSSQGAVRFKVYDKLLESQQTGDYHFWLSVWFDNLPKLEQYEIARFEWTIKPHKAKFVGMRYLKDYSFDGLKELLNYVTQKWGRLCIQSGENQSRWEPHPLWVSLRRMMIEEWDIDHVGIAQRHYHIAPDLNPSYLSSVTGWIAGLMARVGIQKDLDQPADIYDAVMLAQAYSDSIQEKADEKWQILSRLIRKQSDEGE